MAQSRLIAPVDLVTGGFDNLADTWATSRNIGNGNTSFYATFEEAISALEVGEYFTSPASGELRTYQRIDTAPFYLDQGDVAAPLTVALLNRSAYESSLFSTTTTSDITDGVDSFFTRGHSILGLGAARYVRIYGDTSSLTETVWRKQIGNYWYEIDPSDANPASFGALPNASDHLPIIHALRDWMRVKNAAYPINLKHPGFELLVSDQITFQDDYFLQPIRIIGDAYIRATAKTANGTVWLTRNSWLHFDCPSMTTDGGGKQGVLGNNGWSGSGLDIYGSNRSYITGDLGTFKNCRMDPFYRGGKAIAPQQGFERCDVKFTAIDCDGGGSHEPDFGEVNSYLRNARYDVTAINCKYFAFWGLAGNGPSMDPSKEHYELSLRAYNCGGEGLGRVFSSSDVNISTDTISVEDHGFFSRSTIILSGSSLPGGLSISEYWVGRVDKDTLMLSSSASGVVNVPNTSISVDTSGRISKIGHNFNANEPIVYICPTGWTEPDPENPGTQRSLSTPDSIAPSALSNLTRYLGVRLSHNFFALATNTANIRTFTSSSVNISTDIINVPGHGFTTGDAVRVSIGPNNTSITTVNQLMFALQTGTTFTPGTPVNVGSTEASGNDQYKPDTIYYIRAIDADNVALYRSSTSAIADTNRIDITLGGSGTMGLVLVSDIVTFSDRGSGYQTFIKPVNLTTSGDGTIFIGGTAPLVMERSSWGKVNLTGYNDASCGATDIIRGRFLQCDIDVKFDAAIAGRIWESRNMGTVGETATPGSTKSIGNRITVHVSAGGREMAQVSGTAVSGSSTVTVIPTADMLRISVGDYVTASANFPSPTAQYLVLARDSTSVTLDTDATSSGAVTLTLCSMWNRGVLSSADPGLIGGSSTNGTQPLGCSVRGMITGYATGVALMTNVSVGVTFDLIRTEDGQVYFGRSGDFSTIGSDANKFSNTRALQMHFNPIVQGNLFYNDDGSTTATMRGVSSRVPTFADSGGTVVASATTSGWKIQSSLWNGRHLLLGSNHITADSSVRLRIKSSAFTSDTDGTIVGTQS